jgi:GNAT superfamily N-acetyltransferase
VQVLTKTYIHDRDYERVGRFLIDRYDPTGKHVNWLQPRWEYMHFHPYIRRMDLACIGLWEEDGEIVAAVHPEHSMGTAYFQVHPAHGNLKRDMLIHAEEHIAVVREDRKSLGIYINDRDDDFAAMARGMGYEKTDQSEPMSHYAISSPPHEVPLPQGFRFNSLAVNNDLVKLNRLLFRGFNHGEESPDDGIEERRFMQSAPNYRKDINIVVEAPRGDFAAYCGMWYEPIRRVAYVEPVCTDPDYRRMGLGRAVVQEGIRRCGRKGAGVAYVGAAWSFYESVGFVQIYNRTYWKKEWNAGPMDRADVGQARGRHAIGSGQWRAGSRSEARSLFLPLG